MNLKHIIKIADEISVRVSQVEATGKLLEDGATVPFISRYRKEVTGNLDEVQVIAIRDRLEQLKTLDERREFILKSIEEQGKLTDELKAEIMAAETLSKLEDIYLPYKPKKQTRADKAKKRGLEPLAMIILAQSDFNVEKEAEKYINISTEEDKEKQVTNIEEALSGARDIIAEIANEDVEIREKMRELFMTTAVITAKVVEAKKDEKEAQKYRDYFEWSELAKTSPSHRILALRRGADEGFLSFHILPDEDSALNIIFSKYVKAQNSAGEQVKEACQDSYKRLLSLSMETEMRGWTKERADEKAITVFADNLRELLLASPMGQKITLGVDPGLRTGCKVVILDAQGKLLENSAIYPLVPYNKIAESTSAIDNFVSKYGIEAVAVGNGTGGREALDFLKSVKSLNGKIISMVNESGASIYSASEIARKEFPDHDLTVRGAVSIGRRLMDPLAELVKIDPKSIGVGQYQHDVDQKELKKSLDDVVVSCVNAVGVEVNTASSKLLSYVSGLTQRIADRIVSYRESSGPFKNREQIKEVSGVGEKVFEQAAGFLRIANSENPLDSSSVHPESYYIVEKMAKDNSCSIKDILNRKEIRKEIKLNLNKYKTDSIGILTLTDIFNELEKPGRDPRAEFDLFSFTDGVTTIDDLKKGMELAGVITNVTAFGAFVDIGVHQDGLVHLSELSDEFVKDANDVVKVQQKVKVRVIDIDLDRKRISLSMKSKESQNPKLTVKEKSDIKKDGVGNKKFVVSKKPQYTANNRNSKDDTYNPFAELLKNR